MFVHARTPIHEFSILVSTILCLSGCDPKKAPEYGLDGAVQDAKVVPEPRSDHGPTPPDSTLRDGCVPRVERCDGIDDDCDGRIDEFVYTVGDACETESRGLCRPGIIHCREGILLCVGDVEPTEEVCDGLDQDCDGINDEGVPPGDECNSGLLGVCALGHGYCQMGGMVCVPDVRETVEICNGLDDDCDGMADELNPGSGGDCDTGQPGRCAPGIRDCVDGEVVCNTRSQSMSELCNRADDDCDGLVDEGNPGGGAPCTTDQVGACAEGVAACQEGVLGCLALEAPSPEQCNALDDDCDGETDETSPDIGADCVPEAGCGWGQFICSQGALVCEPGSLGQEECNGLDDDCDDRVDEGNPSGGDDCVPDDGCGEGIILCSEAALMCRRLVEPEACNGLDDDCDGPIDEGNPEGGDDCVPEDGCGTGITACVNGDLSCLRADAPPEICNGEDDDCDGVIDEVVQPPCETGEHGPCNEGTLACRRGVSECVPVVAPACEAPNEIDDDCDGVVDEDPDPVCDPPELRVTHFCIDDSDNDLGLGFALGEDGVAHLSRVQRVSGNLLYTTVAPDNTVENERIANRISAIAIDEVDDTDIILFPDGIAICFRDVRQRQLEVALRLADEWIRETVEVNPDAGRDCELAWVAGRLVLAYRVGGVLKMATRNGANDWATEVVDEPARTAAGHGARMVVVGDRLVIVHQDPDLGALRVSWIEGDGWRTAVHRQGAIDIGHRPSVLARGDTIRVFHGAVPEEMDRSSDAGLYMTDIQLSPPSFDTRRLGLDFVGGAQTSMVYDDRTVVLTRMRQRSGAFGDRDGLVLYSEPETGRYNDLLSYEAQAQRHGYLRLDSGPGDFGLPVFVYADQRSPFGDDRGSSKVCIARPTDTDEDRLPDGIELQLGTNPENPDSDGDGATDGEEVIDLNTDPLE